MFHIYRNPDDYKHRKINQLLKPENFYVQGVDATAELLEKIFYDPK